MKLVNLSCNDASSLNPLELKYRLFELRTKILRDFHSNPSFL
jgi:hypothetical protein